MNYVYDPEVAARIAAYVNYISPVEGRQGDPARTTRARRQPADLPGRATFRRTAARLRVAGRRGADSWTNSVVTGGDGEGDGRMSVLRACAAAAARAVAVHGPGAAVAGRLLPGPARQPWTVSLKSGDAGAGFTLHLGTSNVRGRDPRLRTCSSCARSSYAGRRRRWSTSLIAFPLAYFIAFKAGRWRNVMLLLVVLPFFTSYLMRTVAWQTDPGRQQLGRARAAGHRPARAPTDGCWRRAAP